MSFHCLISVAVPGQTPVNRELSSSSSDGSGHLIPAIRVVALSEQARSSAEQIEMVVPSVATMVTELLVAQLHEREPHSDAVAI